MTETIIPAAPNTYATLVDAFMGAAYVAVEEIVAWRVNAKGARPVFYVDIGPDTLALRRLPDGRLVNLFGGSSFDDMDDAKGFAVALRELREEQTAAQGFKNENLGG